MSLCESGWNGSSHSVFRTVERILFEVFFSFVFLNAWLSTCQNYLHNIASLCTRPHVFVFAGPGCIETHSLCAAHFCVLLVWTCRRYLTKARCLLFYYKHELHEQKRLQSFIQWHWGAVGGYIKAPYLPPPPIFNEKQDSPALTKPAICVSVLSLACMFVVFACMLLLCCIYACVKWHHVARASYLWSFMFDLIALRLSPISRGRPMIFWED